jgi:hypothetical protein
MPEVSLSNGITPRFFDGALLREPIMTNPCGEVALGDGMHNNNNNRFYGFEAYNAFSTVQLDPQYYYTVVADIAGDTYATANDNDILLTSKYTDVFTDKYKDISQYVYNIIKICDCDNNKIEDIEIGMLKEIVNSFSKKDINCRIGYNEELVEKCIASRCMKKYEDDNHILYALRRLKSEMLSKVMIKNLVPKIKLVHLVNALIHNNIRLLNEKTLLKEYISSIKADRDQLAVMQDIFMEELRMRGKNGSN